MGLATGTADSLILLKCKDQARVSTLLEGT